jgi:hypothetical protein
MKLLSANLALVFIFIVACSSPGAKVVSEINLLGKDQNLTQVSEIVLQRVYSGCEGCPDHRLTLSREKANEFNEAKVTYSELHTTKRRDGKLSAYYYNTLLQVIESQKYFEMNTEYAMGWEDALQTKLSVKIGDKSKTIQTRNEGEVPIELRTVYMAIDGAALHVVWADGKPSNVTGLAGY